MKAILALALVCMALGASEATRPYGGFLGDPYIEHPEKPAPNVATEWFTQQLDHFNINDQRTWKQRFYLRSTEFDGTGPVFLMIGGEGALSPHWLSTGAMVDTGLANNALMFAVEHRFYGQSRPLGDTSLKSLAYLSSEQALADLATFRQAMARRFKLTDANRWITFGGSYPGALSAWFRYKYPHLVYGAVASSAPINAVLNFPEYYEVATQSLPKACRSAVNVATKSIENHLKTAFGRQHMSQLFRTCKPLTSDKNDLRMFTGTLNDNFFGAVQYDRANRAEPTLGRVNIAQVCALMTKESLGDEVARYAAVNKLFNPQCFDASYKNYVNYMREREWTSTNTNGMRQWVYQTCTEFGYFQTSDSKDQVFGTNTPLEFYVKQCLDIYGIPVKTTKRGITWTNTEYGEYKLAKTGATRIIFVNGSIDPWHALSYLKSEENIIAIYINGTSHCANMYGKSSKDSKELIDARKKIDKIIKGWLAE
jgi:pimeloyl-ACP methyl ester carboxylesterase